MYRQRVIGVPDGAAAVPGTSPRRNFHPASREMRSLPGVAACELSAVSGRSSKAKAAKIVRLCMFVPSEGIFTVPTVKRKSSGPNGREPLHMAQTVSSEVFR